MTTTSEATDAFTQIVKALCRHPDKLRIDADPDTLNFVVVPHPEDFGVLLGKKEPAASWEGMPMRDNNGKPMRGGRMLNSLKVIVGTMATAARCEHNNVILNGQGLMEKNRKRKKFQFEPFWEPAELQRIATITINALFPEAGEPNFGIIETEEVKRRDFLLIMPCEVDANLKLALARIFNCIGSIQGIKIDFKVATEKATGSTL
jgi:predicted RNA-binding protein YlqC (UPF0109 family)